MVADNLAIPPVQLRRLHAPDSAEDALAHLVVTSARHLDDLHEQLTTLAQRTADDLSRVAAGRAQINRLGILQGSASALDCLAGRRADAIDHLKDLIHTYQQATAGSVPQRRHPPNSTVPARDTPTTSRTAHAPRRP